MAIHVYDSSVWRRLAELHVNDNNVWRHLKLAYVYDTSAWRKVYHSFRETVIAGFNGGSGGTGFANSPSVTTFGTISSQDMRLGLTLGEMADYAAFNFSRMHIYGLGATNPGQNFLYRASNLTSGLSVFGSAATSYSFDPVFAGGIASWNFPLGSFGFVNGVSHTVRVELN